MTIIITGTSSGIGKAIAEFYLGQGQRVIGIGRRHTISDAHYTAVNCDLSDLQAVESLDLRAFVTGDVLLINNAGILGNVQRLSDQQQPDIANVLAVNTVAPTMLMHHVARLCGDDHALTVVNISSGAAHRAIPSWSSYCASKAALEMVSETFYREELEKGRPTKVYAVSPGVVDTPMQALIRSVDPDDFAASATFHAYKEQDALASPATVARKLNHLLQLPYTGTVSHSLRDIGLS